MRLAPFAVAALVAGCGTTVPLAQQGAGRSVDGLVLPSSSSTYGTTSAGTTGTSVRGGGSAGAQGRAPRRGPSVVDPTTGSRRAVPRQTGTVEVGFLVAKDVGAATKSLGYDGLSTGNGANQVAASVSLLNARGGLNGRKVRPVVFEQDATRNADTQYQEACGLFFDDHKVAAVVGWGLLPVVQECAARHHVPFVTSGNRTTSRDELGRYANLVVPSQLDVSRVVATLVPSLQAQGWFKQRSATAPVRIGLLYNEDPDFSGVPAMVEHQLKSLGLTLTDKQAMPGTDDTSRVAGASTAGSNAVLRFKTNQITHVLTVDKSGQALAYFAIAAQNQSYYPVLGLSSLELPASLRTVLSKRQLQGARGIGWMPAWDTPTSRQPRLSANANACVAALRKAGEAMDLAATRGSALATCDSTLLLGAAFSARELTLPGFLAGLRTLGTGWPPVMTFADDFRVTRAPASQVRSMAFDAGCDCFLYTGPLTGAAA